MIKAHTRTPKVKGIGHELHSFVKITQENLPQLEQWIARTRALGNHATRILPTHAPESERIEFALGFVDEFGNRSRTTPPFLAHLCGVRIPEPPDPPIDLDERLLWALCLRTPTDGLIDDLSAGPTLNAPNEDAAIEHWTQVELCSLHALWNLNQRAPSASVHDRIVRSGTWVMNELQPDNAINRPWGLPVFVYLSLSLGSEELRTTASMYAQTLAHNCSITLGKPDVLSACILHDSSRTLEGLVNLAH